MAITTTLNVNQTRSVNSLGEWDCTVPSTRDYLLTYGANFQPSSSLVIVVKLNSTTIYTSPTFKPTETHHEFTQIISATAADVIKVILTSAASIDNQLNTIKSTISIGDWN